MPFRDKQNSQSGQAVVEYILLLVIGIALILGLINQLYKPFGNWMKDYMGQYLECLLDVGELPTMGIDGGVCASRFEPFSLKDGRRPKKNEPGSESSEDEAKKNAQKSQSGSSGSAAGSAGTGAAGRRSFPIGNRTGTDGPGSAKNDKEMTEKLPESKFLKTRNSGAYANNSNPSSGGARDTLKIPLRKPVKSEEAEKSIPIDEKEVNGPQREAKKILIKPTERKVANEEEEQPWSFGQYIKFALILVIVIAIVLFLGGQIAQISKSMEK